MSFLKDADRLAHKLTANRKHWKTRVKEEKEAVRLAKQRSKHVTKAQGIIQRIAQITQEKAHVRIGKVVSQCLEAVFEGAYQFKIVFERKRGKTEAKLLFL